MYFFSHSLLRTCKNHKCLNIFIQSNLHDESEQRCSVNSKSIEVVPCAATNYWHHENGSERIGGAIETGWIAPTTLLAPTRTKRHEWTPIAEIKIERWLVFHSNISNLCIYIHYHSHNISFDCHFLQINRKTILDLKVRERTCAHNFSNWFENFRFYLTFIEFILHWKLARFRQQFPDWVPVKPHSVLQSVMRPDNDGRFI